MKLILACALFAAAACSDAPTPVPTDPATTVQHDPLGQIDTPAANPGVVAPPLVAMPPYSPTPNPPCVSCPQAPKVALHE